jgi:hypothetical protein
MPLLSTSVSPEDSGCKYWDTESHTWKTKGLVVSGVEVVNEVAYLVCQSTHLTSFATAVQSSVAQAKLVDPINDAHLLLEYDPLNMSTPITVAVIFTIYIVCLLFFCYLDHRNKRKLQHLKLEIFTRHGRFGLPLKDEKDEDEEEETFVERYMQTLRNEHDW